MIVHNDALVPAAQWHLPPNDRAFCYGDGLFETVLCHQQQPRHWPDHWARLAHGMRTLAFAPPPGFTADLLAGWTHHLLVAEGLTGYARVRIQVWRESGGYYTPERSGVQYIITAQPAAAPALTIRERVEWCESVRLHHSAFSACKTTSALPYVLAGVEKVQRGADDLLLCDAAGHVAEAVAANVFWWRGDAWFTPALQTGCVAGTVRGRLLRHLRATGAPVHEGHFTPGEVFSADGVLLCNVAGAQWLQQLAVRTYPGEGRVTAQKMLTEAGVLG